MEPEHFQNVERVSPWQVEYAGPSASSQPFHPLTELTEPRYFQPLATRNREPHSVMGQEDPRCGLLNLSLFDSNTHFASMQGARHSSDVSVLVGGNTHQNLSDEMFQRSEPSILRSGITEVNPGGHQSGSVPTESHSSLRSFGTEIGNLQSQHGGINSIQLFGKLIYVNTPDESQSVDAGCLEANSSNKDGDGNVGASA